MLDSLTGAIALAYFLMISMATKQHFSSSTYPVGMYVISILSLVGLFSYVASAFSQELVFPFVALALMLAATALFLWAAKSSRDKKLSLAFDDTVKIEGIITYGPWRYVRHPFYVSYTLFWLACAVGSGSLTSYAVLASLGFIYIYSAIREERFLKAGNHGPAYLEYQQTTGFFLPRLPSRQ